MKNYLNLFYGIIDKVDNWELLEKDKKSDIISNFISNNLNNDHLVEYFDKYLLDLLNNTLNSFIKGVDKRKN